MSKYSFSPDTDITDSLINEIKEYLVKERIIDKSNIRMNDNLEETEAAHISIFFAVDLSGSIRPYIDDINRTVKQFVSTVAAKNSYIADSIDFCYVTFNESVKVRRPLGYLSSEDIDAPWTTIQKEELGGRTDIASALFTTWYMAEERKKYLRDELKVRYIQPIIIMISDLMHNVDIPVSDINYSNEGVLLDVILELMKSKVASSSKKVGLAKFAPNTKNQILSDSDAKKIYELNEYNFELKNTDEFAALLDKFFKELTATVADPGKGRVLRTDDEGRLRRKAMQVNSSAHEVGGSLINSEQTLKQKGEADNNVGSFFDSLFD